MTKFFNRLAALVVAVAIFSTPAAAQRALQIDNDSVWEHPHSSIAVPTTLAGLPRARATEFAPDFLNVGFSFRMGDDPEEISLYIYRDTNGGVPVWFEQARIGIEMRDIYANPQLAFGVEQYGWPGNEVWQGQRAVYDTPNSTYSKSTGVVLFSVKGWYVKMRATSSVRTASELRDWIDTAFGEIAPPAANVSQPPAIPVTECAEKLAFKKKAKDAKTDGTAGLMSALLGGMVAEKVQDRQESDEPVEAVAWCRDSSLGRTQVAYRADASINSYLIALGDSGMGVSVAPDAGAALLSEKSKKDQSFAITVITDAQRINFVPQNRLPSLKRVMKIINDNRTISSVSTWGDDSSIEINPNAM
ncbi:hypothetical protein [uncultured Erythrobacter sp.]|uniref:hypothetical protein n=1 Tax=uncultured Erythrobacter sp. TaxID=263913 RepID=UPI00262DE9FA|nr:hypothetical protein [uncultured Erythrobacter sp.]